MRAISSFGLPVRGLRAALTLSLLLAAGSQGALARDGANAALIGGLAGGVLGGVAAGAIINGAQPAPPPPVYRARPVYVEEQPEVIVRRPREPVCHYERRKVWLDDQEFTFKRVEVCE